ncbi:protein scabrous [Tenebrio molitor]|uniref:protein scabrous n=1 Tax=Tenebrio molitor TaxID=7067 RepID=UPI0036246C21
MRSWVKVAFVVVGVCSAACGEPSALEEQLRVLGKQVTTLLDRRREDLASIEDNMRRKILSGPELGDVREEMRKLRLEMEQIQSGSFHRQEPHTRQEKNDHLTVKWLSNAVAELKTELSEVQNTLNSTVILQNHEQVDTELSLLKSDVSNLNKELELARKKNAKYEADLLSIREELASLKDHSRAAAVMCGKTKNQLKAAQLEWNHNWQILNEKKMTMEPSSEQPVAHPSRHQRLLKKHVVDLEKASKSLHRDNERLKTRFLKVEEELELLQKYVQNKEAGDQEYDRINGNDIQDYIRMEKVKEVGRSDFARQQQSNTESIANLTKQMSNFDKLHMSMLELLENVESIENKVDVSFPEFRKEISKLEIQIADAVSQISLLREDQTNTRKSVKAIGVSVSNLQDKTDTDRGRLKKTEEQVDSLTKSASMQTSKLHDHILKTESSTMDMNATKSTIHLVQELKSFEKEYKSIVNKLPHDCGAVSGPSGIYLISPGDGEPILAYCKEGWTTIQKRYDGSVNFNRNWNEYSNGFGSATGEHWLGNRNLHYLTKKNCTKLQINMKDIYGKYWQATYDEFSVADYSMGFKLVVNNYSGNASDALDYQNHMEFSTVDNDRDISNTHCASNYEGGWWFSHCQHANLNGRYNLGLTWFDSSRNEWIAVSQSEMKVKQRENC